MQLYSADMFSPALATVEFIMLRRQLLSISDWSFSYSDLWSVSVYFWGSRSEVLYE